MLMLRIMGNKIALLIFVAEDVRILQSELLLVIWHILIHME